MSWLVLWLLAQTDARTACFEAHEGAQRAEAKGELRKARELALACSKESCAALVRSDCATFFTRIGERLPDVVVVVRERGGLEVEARLQLDDEAPIHSGTRAMAVDPGRHRLIATLSDGRRGETSFVAREGEKLQRVIIELEPAALLVSAVPVSPPAAATRPARPATVLAIVSGAVAVVGLGAFAGLGAWGLSRERSLEACAPACSPQLVEPVRTTYLAADVGLIVGVGAAVVTLVSLLLIGQ